jgi:predicted nicotinamide N-methyase
LAGIAAYLLGASKTLLTDLDYTLDNLRVNVERNIKKNRHENTHEKKHENAHGKGSVEVSLLDWSDKATYKFSYSGECLNPLDVDVRGHEWDVVIGADY